MQTMGQTEMHVGMRSDEFGNISIRTAISQQQMVAQISVDHNDLGQAIANHVSTVQTKLGEEYGLRASIQVNSQGTPFSGDMGGSSQREAQSYGRPPRKMTIEPLVLAESSGALGVPVSSMGGTGLEIRI